MEKMKSLETLERSFVENPRTMIMALVSHKLQLEMGCSDDIVSTVMSGP